MQKIINATMNMKADKFNRKYFKKSRISDEKINDYFIRLEKLRKEIINRNQSFRNSNYDSFELNKADLVDFPAVFYMKTIKKTPIFVQYFDSVQYSMNFNLPNKIEKPKAIILCQHGNSVHGDLFYPLADYLVPQGISIVSIDNMGHGRSGPMRGYMDYPEDMYFVYSKLINHFSSKYPNVPLILYGESLGCAMLSNFLDVSYKYPNSLLSSSIPDYSEKKIYHPISGVIFQVPPYSIRGLHPLTKAIPLFRYLFYPLLRLLDKILPRVPLHKGRNFKFNPNYLKEFNYYDEIDLLINDRFYIRNLASQIIIISHFLRSPAKIPNIPILILQGTGDTILNPGGAVSFKKMLKSSNITLKIYKNAEHSLFMDEKSQAIYFDLLNWLNSNFAILE